ncbi:MAG: helix-turn-helix domain-containing protein [Chloroflexota bacterium]
MPDLLGDKVKHLRRRHGLTQMDLARQVALTSHAHLSNIETGRRPPSLALVIQLANHFTVSTDYLLRDAIAPAEVDTHRVPPQQEPPPDLQFFGDKLRFLRMQRNLSQSDLARQMATVSQAYLSLLEAGRKEPSIEVVLQLADRFGVTTDYLLRDTLPITGDSSSPCGM